jgi:selenide,water dikinase
LAEEGFVPGGTKNNFAHLQGSVTFPETLDQIDQWILCDAVTSGGLLISVTGDQAEALLSDLLEAGMEASIIGETTTEHPGHIMVV